MCKRTLKRLISYLKLKEHVREDFITDLQLLEAQYLDEVSMLLPILFLKSVSAGFSDPLSQLKQSRLVHAVYELHDPAERSNCQPILSLVITGDLCLITVLLVENRPDSKVALYALPECESSFSAKPTLVLCLDHLVELIHKLNGVLFLTKLQSSL